MKRVSSLQSGSSVKILHLVLNKLVRIYSHGFSEEKIRLLRKTWACILPKPFFSQGECQSYFSLLFIYMLFAILSITVQLN